MKQILFIFIFAGITSLARSQVILDMENVFGVTPCNVWCWNRVTTNMLYYYFGSTPSKNEIAEMARQHNMLDGFCNCTTCILIPDSCCKALKSSASSLLYHYGLKCYNVEIPTCNELEDFFSLNKPVIINTTGHVITAHGINGENVYVIDGNGQDAVIRDYDDICPGRDWVSTDVVQFSPDCSDVNEVTHRIFNSSTYYSNNTMKISGRFENNSMSVFHSDNNAVLEYLNHGDYDGFKVYLGSSVLIYTGENNCP